MKTIETASDGTQVKTFSVHLHMDAQILTLTAKNLILYRALEQAIKAQGEYMDMLEIENFGDDANLSVCIAVAAQHYGLGNPGDSAFDLKTLTPTQAANILVRRTAKP